MIPSRWPDPLILFLPYLRELHEDVTFTRTQQDTPADQVVIDYEYQQMETDISRRCTLLLEARSKRANNTAHVARSFEVMNDVLYSLQLTPQRLTPVVRFDSIVGPRIAKDGQKFEYHEGSIVLVLTP